MSGMNRLADAMLSEAKKEAEEIISQAENESAKALETSKEASKDDLKKSEEDAKSRLKSQKKEKVAWARLEKKKILSEAKEDVVKQELEKIILELPNLRKHEKYGAFIKEKARIAVEEVGKDQGIFLHVCKGDKRFISGLKGNVSVFEDLDSSGGVLAENSSRTVRVDYTLESLFEIKKPETRREIYESLFGGK